MAARPCRHDVTLGAILGIALLARLVLLLYYLRAHSWVPETWEYETVAQNLLGGRGFVYRHHGLDYLAYYVPLFPLVCAILHLIGGPGYWPYYLFQLSIALAMIALCRAIASRLVSVRSAALIALLAALEPGLLVYQSYKIDPTALCQFLSLLCAWLLIPQGDRPLPTYRRCALLGAVIGAGMLTRPDMLALLLALGALFLLAGEARSGAARRGAIILGAALLAITPWGYRNRRVLGAFVPFSSVSGEVLWNGNNPNSTGSALTFDLRAQFWAAPAHLRSQVRQAAGELEADNILGEDARDYIRADIAGFLARTCRKFWYFWWFAPTFGSEYRGWIPIWAQNAYKLMHAVLLGLACAGAWAGLYRPATRLHRPLAFYLLAVPLALAAIHAIHYVETRHRLLALPLLLVLSGLGLDRLLGACLRLENAAGTAPPH